MARAIKPEWLNTQLINTLRWEEDDEKMIEMSHSTLDLKRRKKMTKRVGLWLDRNKAVIVSMADNIEARSIITSDMANYVLYSAVPKCLSPGSQQLALWGFVELRNSLADFLPGAFVGVTIFHSKHHGIFVELDGCFFHLLKIFLCKQTPPHHGLGTNLCPLILEDILIYIHE